MSKLRYAIKEVPIPKEPSVLIIQDPMSMEELDKLSEHINKKLPKGMFVLLVRKEAYFDKIRYSLKEIFNVWNNDNPEMFWSNMTNSKKVRRILKGDE